MHQTDFALPDTPCVVPYQYKNESTRLCRPEPEQRKPNIPQSAKTKAEKMFAATQDKDNLVVREKEKRQQDRSDHQTTLRTLRLAKEVADKKAAEKADS